MKLNNYSVEIVSNDLHSYGIPKNEDKGYVIMKDSEQYGIKLTNHSNKKTNATISIDGSSVGTFRIDPYDTFNITRPSDTPKNFTFYEIGSSGAKKAGIVKGESENGLISVSFIPEKTKYTVKSSQQSVYPSTQGYPSHRGFSSYESFPSQGHTPSSLGGMFFSCNNGKESIDDESDDDMGFDIFDSCTIDLPPKNKKKRKSNFKQGGTGLQGYNSQKFKKADKIELDYNNETVINLRLVANGEDYNEITSLKNRMVYKTPIPSLPV